jgi:predicted Rossmann-fold nucleotide-binding protein
VADAEGDIVVTGAEVGIMDTVWSGAFKVDVLTASFIDTLELEYDGTIYPVDIDGSISATLVAE